ncbi:MAG: NAD(P)H-hydrate epimerase [Thaumarchaeota archaeon]|nr:NAD(P)H-hydrate epimerase [Nitrososphaerota archaeon]
MIRPRYGGMDFLTPERMRELEFRAAQRGIGVDVLMENAGRAVARAILDLYGTRRDQGRTLLVICGTGNNGGDGFVAARYLSMKWEVRVLILAASPSMIKTKEARDNLERLSKEPVEYAFADAGTLASRGSWFEDATIIVDAILGTGVKGEVREPVRTAIGMVNGANGIKVAIDIPSGLDPATGNVTEGGAVKADLTIALHAQKTGLKGKETYTGKIVSVPIGLSEE